MKVRKSAVRNVPDVRVRPKIFSRQFLAAYWKNTAASRVFVEVSNDDLVKFS